jgi:hypothetical protein
VPFLLFHLLPKRDPAIAIDEEMEPPWVNLSSLLGSLLLLCAVGLYQVPPAVRTFSAEKSLTQQVLSIFLSLADIETCQKDRPQVKNVEILVPNG